MRFITVVLWRRDVLSVFCQCVRMLLELLATQKTSEHFNQLMIFSTCWSFYWIFWTDFWANVFKWKTTNIPEVYSERDTHWSAYKYKDWVDYSERNLVFVSVRLSAEWLTDEENKTIKTQIKSNNKIHINNTNKLRNVYLSLMMGKVSTWGISKIKTLTVLFLNRMCKYWKKCSNSV